MAAKTIMQQVDSETQLSEDQKSTDGGAHVRTVASEVTKSNEDGLEVDIALTAATQVLEISGLKPYKRATLVLRVMSATSLDITVSADGSNYSAIIQAKNVSTGVFGAITATGVYEVDAQVKSMRLTQIGAGAVTGEFITGAK